MKRKYLVFLSLIIIMFVLGLAACDSSNGISGTQNEKGQVPVYQGMTISNKSQSHSLKAENVSLILLTDGENLGKNSNYMALSGAIIMAKMMISIKKILFIIVIALKVSKKK